MNYLLLKLSPSASRSNTPLIHCKSVLFSLRNQKQTRRGLPKLQSHNPKRTHGSGCIYVPRITSMPNKASTEHTQIDFLIHMTGSMSMLLIVIIRHSWALFHTLPTLHILITMEMATGDIT
ncbi:hypothetical protein BHE74_00008224 [Ensete ventricosum]|nr:hypothetical protein BHE74_00008224 [Ensete ventricosum]